jgi:Ca2+-binding RTX toxin-like protein
VDTAANGVLVLRGDAAPSRIDVSFTAEGGRYYLVLEDRDHTFTLHPQETECYLLGVHIAVCPYPPGIDAELGEGNDAFFPDPLIGGNMNLKGQAGNDVLFGGAREDVLEGGDGDDIFRGHNFPDDFHGGPGKDTVTYEERIPDPHVAGVVVSLDGRDNDGNSDDRGGGSFGVARSDNVLPDVERVIGSPGPDRLVANEDASFDAELVGLAGDDRLRGRAGDDTLSGGPGADEFDGSAGFDTIDYGDHEQSVRVDMRHPDNWGAVDERDRRDTDTIERVLGGSGNDLLVGRDGGPDILSGGRGRDEVYGLGGNDTVTGGLDSDRLGGHAGRDQIFGEGGNDELFGDEGPDQLNGGLGDDVLHGGSKGDVLHGNDGLDQLTGDSGNDILFGDADGDVLRADTGSDLMVGGRGLDRASYQSRKARVRVVLNDNHPDGGAGEKDRITTTEALTGGAGDDLLVGDADQNIMSGGPGRDEVYGRGSEDHLFGGDGDDRVGGHGGRDELHGDNGDDEIFGDEGADGLLGDQGNDVIHGGPGSDHIFGHAGADRLIGDQGNDDLTGGADVNTYNAGTDNDIVRARNGRAEAVNCGPGTDQVGADSSDRLTGCEGRLSGPAGGAPPGRAPVGGAPSIGRLIVGSVPRIVRLAQQGRTRELDRLLAQLYRRARALALSR